MRKAAANAGADLDRFAGVDPDTVQDERETQWEERLRALARAAGIDLTALPEAKSHPQKALLASAMKASSSVSNVWLANRLAMGEPASASQFARRWMLDRTKRAETTGLLARIGGVAF